MLQRSEAEPQIFAEVTCSLMIACLEDTAVFVVPDVVVCKGADIMAFGF